MKSYKQEYSLLRCLMKPFLLFTLIIGWQAKTAAQSKNEDLKCYNIAVSLFESYKKQIRETLDKIYPTKIPLSVQDSAGLEIYDIYNSQMLILDDTDKQERVDKIIRNLTNYIKEPQGFKYEVFIVNANNANAITCGGKIFISDTLIDFCENDDELACFISHEIMHNELGHIELQLRDEKFLNLVFNHYAETIEDYIDYLKNPFLQEDEANCDMYGLDLAYAAGFEVCAFKKFLNRMSEKENDKGIFEEFLSTHPSSKLRANCIGQYIQKYFQTSCNM